MASYRERPCAHCSQRFQPLSSRHAHCSWECRFLSIAAPFQNAGGCWEWPLSANKRSGYGQFMVSTQPGVLETAHRASWRVFRGEIPPGLNVCHECDNRRCFNPKHLFVGTQADNVLDMFKKNRQAKDKNLRKLDRHPNAKLSEAAVLAIRQSRAPTKEWAALLGVSSSAINQARRGATWRTAAPPR